MLNRLSKSVYKKTDKDGDRYADVINIAGAIDIEAFDNATSPENTKKWIDAYTATTSILYYNFGSCDDCPTTIASQPEPEGKYPIKNSKWSLEDYWYVSWYALPALPLPEIYLSNNNELQWATLKTWAQICKNCQPATVGGSYRNIWFAGAMTQKGACDDLKKNGRDTGPSCFQRNSTTPEQPLGQPVQSGWLLLANALNQPRLRWATDITWDNP